MGKKLSLFKRQEDAPLEPGINLALREMAGWPLQTHQQGARRHRHRTLTVLRDGDGRVINSLEHIEEDEYEEYSDTWGK